MNRRNTVCVRAIICATTLVYSTPLLAAPFTPFTPVALSGQDAPGASGAQFQSFFPPIINNAGVVTLFGTTTELLRPNSNFAQGIWTGTPGNLNLLALENQPAPGANGPFYNIEWARSSSDAGLVAFGGEIDQPINSSHGVWAGTPGNVQLVAYPGLPAPGTAGTFNEASHPTVNRAGQLLLHSSFTESGQSVEGIWTGNPSSLQLLVRHGQPAPSIPGSTFGPFYDLPEETSGTFGPVTISSNGDVVFAAGLSTGGVPSGSALYTGRPGNLRLIARDGSEAPGLPATHFTGLGLLGDIAAGGDHVLFEASAEGPVGNNVRGYWLASPSGMQLIARDQGDAPGTGTTFGFLSGSSFDVNAAGDVAFMASLAGDSASGQSIWAGKPGDLRLIVLGGQPAVGFDESLTLDINASGITLNEAGQFAFEAVLRDSAGAHRGTALYAADPDGGLLPIVAAGQVFEVAPGDFRTVARISFTGYQHPSLNDSGQLTFGLIFTDNSSGVFVTTVPEPSSVLLLGLPLAMIAARRRR